MVRCYDDGEWASGSIRSESEPDCTMFRDGMEIGVVKVVE